MAPKNKILSNLAEEQERKNIMLDGDVNAQVAALIDALTREGVLEA